MKFDLEGPVVERSVQYVDFALRIYDAATHTLERSITTNRTRGIRATCYAGKVIYNEALNQVSIICRTGTYASVGYDNYLALFFDLNEGMGSNNVLDFNYSSNYYGFGALACVGTVDPKFIMFYAVSSGNPTSVNIYHMNSEPLRAPLGKALADTKEGEDVPVQVDGVAKLPAGFSYGSGEATLSWSATVYEIDGTDMIIDNDRGLARFVAHEVAA